MCSSGSARRSRRSRATRRRLRARHSSAPWRWASSLGDSATIFPALWGTSSYWFVLGEHQHRLPRWSSAWCGSPRSRTTPASDSRRPSSSGTGDCIWGISSERGRSSSARPGHLGLEPIADFPEDSGIVSRSTLSVVLWFLGEAAASRETASEALDLADSLDPAGRRAALTACWVRVNLAWRVGAGRRLGAGDRVCRPRRPRSPPSASYPTWFAAATLHRSIAQCRLGRFDEGLPTLVAMVDAWRAAGRDETGRQRHPMLMTPYFAGRLAEAQLAGGDADSAAGLVDELLAETARSGERFWDVELLRLRAAAAQARGAPPEAVRADLDAARELASEQGARALAEGLEGGGKVLGPATRSAAMIPENLPDYVERGGRQVWRPPVHGAAARSCSVSCSTPSAAAIDALLHRDFNEPSGGAVDYRCAHPSVIVIFADDRRARLRRPAATSGAATCPSSRSRCGASPPT